MPQIIVTAGQDENLKQGTVVLRERLNTTDFESERFAANLLERLGWAVEDATVAEQRELAPTHHTPEPADRERPEPTPDWDPSPVGVA